MNIQEWAIKHHIPLAALEDLKVRMGMQNVRGPACAVVGRSETATQNAVRLDEAKKGNIVWRNNVGALCDRRGIPIRYGLANESKKMNDKVKSADLIGIEPVRILPSHVGTVIGRFKSIECKPGGWRYTGSPHELAQKAFAEIVIAHGGSAEFNNGEGLK